MVVDGKEVDEVRHCFSWTGVVESKLPVRQYYAWTPIVASYSQCIKDKFFWSSYLL